jgi:hypothetical protein
MIPKKVTVVTLVTLSKYRGVEFGETVGRYDG